MSPKQTTTTKYFEENSLEEINKEEFSTHSTQSSTSSIYREPSANTSIIAESTTYTTGWVDSARILSEEEFIEKLRENLR